MHTQSSRTRAFLALLLLVPIPSIGIACALLWIPGRSGQTVFTLAKIWLALGPLIWWRLVLGERWSWSKPQQGGFGVAAALGAIIAVIIYAAYLFIGRNWIDKPMVRRIAFEAGLRTTTIYLVACLYWILINSLIEEYVWRWFVLSRCRLLIGPTWAVLASALFFTLHHIIALGAYFDWRITALGSIGVYIGGAVWSWCYLRYQSIWPGYVSHAIVDVPIFVIGYQLVFR